MTRSSAYLSDLLKLAAGGEPSKAVSSARRLKTTVETQSGPAEPLLDPDVADWLGRLRLLYGVPFEYLVPDPRMLPTESIRFFYLDRNWTDRAVDGAMSIGARESLSRLKQTTMDELRRAAVDQAEQEIRSTLRGRDDGVDPAPGALITGFVLRSRVVSGWPGIEVDAFSDKECKDKQKLLRLDRPSPDILLALFSGTKAPACVTLREPSETLHFGIEGDVETPYAFLRGLGYPTEPPDKTHPAGEQITEEGTGVTFPITMRPVATKDDPKGVIDVSATARTMETSLKKYDALRPDCTPATPIEPGTCIRSAEFAVEMIRSAGLQPFVIGAGNPALGAPQKAPLKPIIGEDSE